MIADPVDYGIIISYILSFMVIMIANPVEKSIA